MRSRRVILCLCCVSAVVRAVIRPLLSSFRLPLAQQPAIIASSVDRHARYMPFFFSATTPPPLHSSSVADSERALPTREPSPVATPPAVLASADRHHRHHHHRRSSKDTDLSFSGLFSPDLDHPRRRPPADCDCAGCAESGTDTGAEDDNDGEDDDVCAFPLLSASPPALHRVTAAAATMDMPTSVPLDMSTPRTSSVSPPGQQASNLTSALMQQASHERAAAGSHGGAYASSYTSYGNGGHGASGTSALKTAAPRKESFGAMQWATGTKPINVAGASSHGARRESLAGSLMGGMSWGPASVGSWIRDE